MGHINVAPLSKKGTTQKISILQEKKEGGSILHVTNSVTDRISSTYTGYSCRWSCHLFTCHREPLVEWFATQLSLSQNSSWPVLFRREEQDAITTLCSRAPKMLSFL
jgi:hypothetical protein